MPCGTAPSGRYMPTPGGRITPTPCSVVDLFCALAENPPELLPVRWSTLFDVIAAEERFWVYTSAKVGEIEDVGEAAFVPFLRRSALIKEWAQLLEHARRVDACRETGRAWGYTC